MRVKCWVLSAECCSGIKHPLHFSEQHTSANIKWISTQGAPNAEKLSSGYPVHSTRAAQCNQTQLNWSQFEVCLLHCTVLNFLVTFALSSLIFAWLQQQITTEAKQQITDRLPLKLLFCHSRSTFWLILSLQFRYFLRWHRIGIHHKHLKCGLLLVK